VFTRVRKSAMSLPQPDSKISATTGYAMKSMQGRTKRGTIANTRGGQKIMWLLTYISDVLCTLLSLVSGSQLMIHRFTSTHHLLLVELRTKKLPWSALRYKGWHKISCKIRSIKNIHNVYFYNHSCLLQKT
jgi:hypothetical protein